MKRSRKITIEVLEDDIAEVIGVFMGSEVFKEEKNALKKLKLLKRSILIDKRLIQKNDIDVLLKKEVVPKLKHFRKNLIKYFSKNEDINKIIQRNEDLYLRSPFTMTLSVYLLIFEFRKTLVDKRKSIEFTAIMQHSFFRNLENLSFEKLTMDVPEYKNLPIKPDSVLLNQADNRTKRRNNKIQAQLFFETIYSKMKEINSPSGRINFHDEIIREVTAFTNLFNPELSQYSILNVVGLFMAELGILKSDQEYSTDKRTGYLQYLRNYVLQSLKRSAKKKSMAKQ